MKILIVKLSAIGDVIHCLPVAAALKSALPDAHLAWLVDRGSAELLRNNECVDEVITFEGKRWSRDLKNLANWSQVGSDATSFLRQLRAKQFDVAVEMQGLFKSGALALASGAKIRIGFNGTREFAESFLTHRIDVGDYFGHDVPVVELNLKIVAALLKLLGSSETVGKPLFMLPPVTGDVWQKVESLVGIEHIKNAPQTVAQDASSGKLPTSERSESYVSPGAMPLASGGANSILIPNVLSTPDLMPSIKPDVKAATVDCILIPGTTWVTKIWPADYWYQLGAELVRRYNYRLLIIGANSEIADNAHLFNRLNEFQGGCAVDLTNKTSLLDLAALFLHAELVVGGDTGPLHLAAAVGAAKVVGIYGSTPWRRNGPYGEQSRSVSLQLECQPCYSKQCKVGTLDCLRKLTVNHVMDVIEEIRGSG